MPGIHHQKVPPFKFDQLDLKFNGRISRHVPIWKALFAIGYVRSRNHTCFLSDSHSKQTLVDCSEDLPRSDLRFKWFYAIASIFRTPKFLVNISVLPEPSHVQSCTLTYLCIWPPPFSYDFFYISRFGRLDQRVRGFVYVEVVLVFDLSLIIAEFELCGAVSPFLDPHGQLGDISRFVQITNISLFILQPHIVNGFVSCETDSISPNIPPLIDVDVKHPFLNTFLKLLVWFRSGNIVRLRLWTPVSLQILKVQNTHIPADIPAE
mmetsp:Transcript_17222/g.30899  ORF Transcript_17222/g.30899 Transcript_17222/m.30899 type:complete len:264 (+) Transcript_17222:127-918(+)